MPRVAVIEIRPTHDFFTYEAKYTRGRLEYLVPAPLDKSLDAQVRRWRCGRMIASAVAIFRGVDLILAENNNCFVLEVNTIPAFTETSLVPKRPGRRE